jgi:hypothetical protein
VNHGLHAEAHGEPEGESPQKPRPEPEARPPSPAVPSHVGRTAEPASRSRPVGANRPLGRAGAPRRPEHAHRAVGAVEREGRRLAQLRIVGSEGPPSLPIQAARACALGAADGRALPLAIPAARVYLVHTQPDAERPKRSPPRTRGLVRRPVRRASIEGLRPIELRHALRRKAPELRQSPIETAFSRSNDRLAGSPAST